MYPVDNRGKPLVTDYLVVGIECEFDILGAERLHLVEQVVRDLHRLKGKFGLADLGLYLLDEPDHLFDLLMALDDRVEHNLIRDLVRARLDHADDILIGGDGEVEVAHPALFGVRADDDFPVHQTDVCACDRSVPGDIRDREGK